MAWAQFCLTLGKQQAEDLFQGHPTACVCVQADIGGTGWRWELTALLQETT